MQSSEGRMSKLMSLMSETSTHYLCVYMCVLGRGYVSGCLEYNFLSGEHVYYLNSVSAVIVLYGSMQHCKGSCTFELP